MMPDEQQTELPTQHPDPKDFWALYAHTLDWQILIVKMVQKATNNDGTTPLDPKIAVVGYRMQPNQPQVPIYYLSREFFPVEKIAAFLGKQPSQLDGIEEIHLRDFKDGEGKVIDLTKWEKPSVEYWGFA